VARPIVSTIIPTHNRCDLLAEALASVYAQEALGAAFDVEVLVVDDASTDATADVVRRWAGVRYVRLDRPAGACAARNAGLELARGQFVAFLDDDDVWLPHKLRVQVPVLEGSPDVGVVYAQNTVQGAVGAMLWPDAALAPSGHVFSWFLLDDFVTMNAVVVRRDVFQVSGYFDETVCAMGHYDMFLRAARHVAFRFMPVSVATCRISERGMWLTAIRSGAYRTALSRAVERALDTLPPESVSDAFRVRVQTSVFARVVYHEGSVRPPEEVRAYVAEMLDRWPALLLQDLARNALVLHARRVAAQGTSPDAEVAALCGVVAAAGQRMPEGRAVVRELLGWMWLAAAKEFWRRGGRYRRAGMGAAWTAWRCAPAVVGKEAVRKTAGGVWAGRASGRREAGAATTTERGVPIHPGIAIPGPWAAARQPVLGPGAPAGPE
jgi:glycosyltransferase involved in cell wall biosynthesis